MALPDFITSKVVPAVGSLISKGVNSQIDYYNSKRLMDYQNKLQLEQWNRQNAYDHPAAYMQRMLSAGLNPDLLASGSVPNGSPAGAVGMPSVGHAAESAAYAQLALLKSQKENIDADTAHKREETKDISETREPRIEGITADNFFKSLQSTTEYQRGVALALRNFADGYRPHPDEESGDLKFQQVYDNLDQASNIIDEVRDERELTRFDVRYMRSVFKTMVEHDEEAFKHEVAEWRKNSSVLKYLSEHEFAQFLDYLVGKLAPSAAQFGVAYRSFRGNGSRNSRHE